MKTAFALLKKYVWKTRGKLKEGQKIVSDNINVFPSIDVEENNQNINEEIGNMYQDKELKQILTTASNLIINGNYIHFNNII